MSDLQEPAPTTQEAVKAKSHEGDEGEQVLSRASWVKYRLSTQETHGFSSGMTIKRMFVIWETPTSRRTRQNRKKPLTRCYAATSPTRGEVKELNFLANFHKRIPHVISSGIDRIWEVRLNTLKREGLMLDKIIKNCFSLGVSSLVLLDSCYAGLPAPTLHPILVKVEDCLKKNESTAGQGQCLQEELKDWDTELNKVYTQLMGTLTPQKVKDSLKTSQQAWLSFRDKEFAFLRAYYNQQQGTIWSIVAGKALAAIVKDRVKELYETLESVDMSGDSSKNYTFEIPS